MFSSIIIVPRRTDDGKRASGQLREARPAALACFCELDQRATKDKYVWPCRNRNQLLDVRLRKFAEDCFSSAQMFIALIRSGVQLGSGLLNRRLGTPCVFQLWFFGDFSRCTNALL